MTLSRQQLNPVRGHRQVCPLISSIQHHITHPKTRLWRAQPLRSQKEDRPGGELLLLPWARNLQKKEPTRTNKQIQWTCEIKSRMQNSTTPMKQQEQLGDSSVRITAASQDTRYLMKQVLRLKSTRGLRELKKPQTLGGLHRGQDCLRDPTTLPWWTLKPQHHCNACAPQTAPQTQCNLLKT